MDYAEVDMDPRTLDAFTDELRKIAGVADTVRRPEVFLPALGAAVMGTAQYLVNRAPKGGKSSQQRAFLRAEKASKDRETERKRSKQPQTLTGELDRITAKPLREIADLSAKHPLKMALPTAAFGAMAGRTLARAL